MYLGAGVAEGEEEALGGGVVDQGEEFQGFEDADHGGGLLARYGVCDEAAEAVPEDVVALVDGDLDHGGGGLGDLVGRAVDEDDALGLFRAQGEELCDGDLEGGGDVFKFGDGGVALDAGEEVAGAGAHPVGHVREGEAFLFADVPKVLL